jgi:thiamine-phosphate pyrophosphorylase
MSAPRLYLLTPPLMGTETFAPRLAAALGAGEVASVLVRLAADSDPKRAVTPLLEIAAAHDAALLIGGDARLAARLGADGVHVDATAVADAIASCHPQRIVGAGGLLLRDDAMTAAEAGVDYVMFGEPGAALSPEATYERVGWWAEIFQTPCVGYASNMDEVAALAAAGADFVALDAAVWDARDVAVAVRTATELLRRRA